MSCFELRVAVCLGMMLFLNSSAFPGDVVDGGISSDEKSAATDSSKDSQSLAFDWVNVTEKAGWQPRDSQGEVVFNDKLWLMGGWFQ